MKSKIIEVTIKKVVNGFTAIVQTKRIEKEGDIPQFQTDFYAFESRESMFKKLGELL